MRKIFIPTSQKKKILITDHEKKNPEKFVEQLQNHLLWEKKRESHTAKTVHLSGSEYNIWLNTSHITAWNHLSVQFWCRVTSFFLSIPHCINQSRSDMCLITCMFFIGTFISTRNNNYRIYFSKRKWCGLFVNIKASSDNLNY